MQLSDGGWGWFSGWGEHRQPHTTAIVVHGLQIAKQNDVALVPGVLERGVEWLKHYQDEQVRRWLKNAAGKETHRPRKKPTMPTTSTRLSTWCWSTPTSRTPTMRDFLYRDRTQLAVYAKACSAWPCTSSGEADKLAMILREHRASSWSKTTKTRPPTSSCRRTTLVVLVRQRDTKPRPTT